jgi:hypothetical protein
MRKQWNMKQFFNSAKGGFDVLDMKTANFSSNRRMMHWQYFTAL